MKVLGIVVAALLAFVVLNQIFCSSPPVTNPEPSGSTIVCFGDSLTFGTGANVGEDYPTQLAKLIGREVINAGVPGDTTADGLRRLEEDVLGRDPMIVLITLGGNDLRREIPREEAFGNLRTIVDRLHRRGVLVVVGGVDVPLFARGYDEGYKELRRSTGCLLIPNVLKGLMGKSHLMSDGIHPNGNGYAILARRFADEIEPYLK